jgi:predicted MFS family arabinose efflux permease
VALIAVLSLVGLLSVTGEGTARTFFNVYLDTGLSVSTSRIGTLSAVAQLLALPAALAMPLLSNRFGRQRTLLSTYAARALCLLPLALVPHWLAAGGGFIGLMVIAGLNRPAFIAFHQESVRPRWRTAISGATTTAVGLGFAAAAFGGGYLVTALGYRALFLTGAALSLAGTLVFWSTFFARGRRGTLGGE